MSDVLFHVKICGVTTADDARMIADSGADAIGLNFYPKSPRYVDDPTAGQIVSALPSQIRRIGVFVNEPVAEMRRRAEQLGLDAIQLHGDEAAELLNDLEGLTVIRAFRVADSLAPIEQFVGSTQEASQHLAMLLVDSRSRGQYGGTGETADWKLLARHSDHPHWPPLALAGGLTPENVAEAIRQVRPAAVDTASGVESSPGRKAPQQVQRFVENAKAALAEIA